MDAANAAVPAPKANMGEPIARTESIAKVTGSLVYAADTPKDAPLQAYFLRAASSVAESSCWIQSLLRPCEAW